MKRLFALCLVISALFSSCSDEKVYMSFPNVEYIAEFPDNISLDKTEPMDIDLMGCVDLFGGNNLIVFKYHNLDYFWRIYSLEANQFLGEYLEQGTGPKDFLHLPSDEFLSDNDSTCRFWDYQKKKIYLMNINKSIETGKTVIDDAMELKLNGSAQNGVYLNETLCFVAVNRGISMHRSLLVQGERKELPYLNPLNQISPRNDLNTIAAARAFNIEGQMVAEAMLHLNQINLYSLSDSTQVKTICVGEQLTDLAAVDDSNKRSWTKYYGDIQSYEHYFAALYLNIPREKFLKDEMYNASIQLFDWSGSPLLNINVPYPVKSFLISRDGYLYTLSMIDGTECLHKFDIRSSLAKLEK